MKTPPGLLTVYVNYKDSSALTTPGFCQHTSIKLLVWLQHKKNLMVCICHTHPSDLKSLLTITFKQLSTQWVWIFHIYLSSKDFCSVTVKASIITLRSPLRSWLLQHLPCWHSRLLLNPRLAAPTWKAPTQGARSALESIQFMAIYTGNSASLQLSFWIPPNHQWTWTRSFASAHAKHHGL